MEKLLKFQANEEKYSLKEQEIYENVEIKQDNEKEISQKLMIIIS